MITDKGFCTYTNLDIKVHSLTLGEELRDYRVKEGLTQKDMVKASGMTQPMIVRIEKNKHDITIKQLTKYLSCFGCLVRIHGLSPEYLIKQSIARKDTQEKRALLSQHSSINH